MSSKRRADQLRSHRWFGDSSMRAFAHRQRTQQMGYGREDFMGRPVIAIINTWSDLSTCHTHLRDRAETVKQGILRAGGFPVELPALSLGEVMVKPTTMFYRNFLAMEAEELLRSHPVDGVVLMGGCDKTTPGLLMGAISMNLPAVYIPAGASLSGNWRGEKIGTGTHTRKYWDELRAGTITQEDWVDLEEKMTRSVGTCNTMGTASTMTAIAEVLGFSLPGAQSIPAADSGHVRMCGRVGERIVQMVWDDLKPSDFLTEKSFENALVVDMALGGSTNAIVHLLAMAGRAGVKLTLDDFDRVSRQVPVLANLMPSGKYLMEDFFYAGGLPALLKQVESFLHLEAQTVTGASLGENIAKAKVWNEDVIRSLDNPITDRGTVAVLRGNLAPNGAVMKPSAASPELLKHRGKALVFENHADMSARIDDPALDVDASTVLVLKNAGPVGGPGLPEWGGLPIPKKLLKQGVRDMVRVSDARMSGTHFGTCVLHVTPESAIGGPLALVRTGDEIELDVAARRIELLVDDAELERRRAEWKPAPPRHRRGWGVLYANHVTQADKGCDFDFLEGAEPVPEPEIF